MDVAKDMTSEIMLLFFHKKIIEYFQPKIGKIFAYKKKYQYIFKTGILVRINGQSFLKFRLRHSPCFAEKNTQRNQQRCHSKSATEKVIAHCLQQWNVKAKLKTNIFFANRDLKSRHFA